MADNKKQDLPENKSEIDDILGQLTETSSDPVPARKTAAPEEIIKKPVGSKEQPDDLAGMLEQISEQPEKAEPKLGFFQKLMRFFKKP